MRAIIRRWCMRSFCGECWGRALKVEFCGLGEYIGGVKWKFIAYIANDTLSFTNHLLNVEAVPSKFSMASTARERSQRTRSHINKDQLLCLPTMLENAECTYL